jgi:hypothetical protein
LFLSKDRATTHFKKGGSMMLTFQSLLYSLEKPNYLVKYDIKNPTMLEFIKFGNTLSFGKSMTLSKNGSSIFVITKNSELLIFDSDHLKVIKKLKSFYSLFLTSNFDLTDNEMCIFANRASQGYEVIKLNLYKNKSDYYLKNHVKTNSLNKVFETKQTGMLNTKTYTIKNFSNLRRLYFSSNTRELNLFNTNNNKRLSKVTHLYTKFITVCEKLLNKGILLVGGWDSKFYVFDISGSRFEILGFVNVPDDIFCLSISPKKTYFACSGRMSQVMVFSICYDEGESTL